MLSSIINRASLRLQKEEGKKGKGLVILGLAMAPKRDKRGKFRFLFGFSRGGEASIGVGNKKKSLTARVSFFGLK